MILTRSELEIMDVLWAAQAPLSRSDLLERSEEKNWKDSSVHILLNGLLRKEAIREEGYIKRSKTYARTFVPTMTREEYFAGLVFSFRHKPEPVGLVKALLEQTPLQPEELEAIAALVQNKMQ